MSILGYHLVKSTYGSWLPGDERGHWSSAWDEQIGYYQPHHLHEGDPVRKRMAEELMGTTSRPIDGSDDRCRGGCARRMSGSVAVADCRGGY